MESTFFKKKGKKLGKIVGWEGGNNWRSWDGRAGIMGVVGGKMGVVGGRPVFTKRGGWVDAGVRKDVVILGRGRDRKLQGKKKERML